MTSTSTQSAKSPDLAGIPFHSASSNYNSACSAQGDIIKPTQIHIPDGRQNADGEKIPSPVETWKPNYARKQSWSQQDLKRELLMNELGHKKGEGQGTGFTEGGEGSRVI